MLMLNERIRNVTDLERALINAERKLKPYEEDVRADLRAPTLLSFCRAGFPLLHPLTCLACARHHYLLWTYLQGGSISAHHCMPTIYHDSRLQISLLVQGHRQQCLCDIFRTYAMTDAPQARWHEVSQMLRAMGFEVGWGSTVGRVKESMHELLDILQVRHGLLVGT